MGESRIRIPRPLRAYVLSDRSEYSESCRVVFALNARDARGYGLADVEYVDTAARRASELDVFSPGPVPTEALLEHGWWFECSGGCPKILRDGDGGIVRGRDVYCSPACVARDDGRMRGQRLAHAERDAFLAEARRRWPDAHVCWYGWNRPAYREPLPADGFRLSARLHWKRPDADVYANWWDGDADHGEVEVYPREVRRAG